MSFSIGDRGRLCSPVYNEGEMVSRTFEDVVVLQRFMTTNYTESYLVCTKHYELKAVPYYELKEIRDDEGYF